MKIRLGIAEDDRYLMKTIKANLSLFDDVDVVFCASNGIEVLEHVNNMTVDLILMDINMPQLDGIKTTYKIKKKFPEIKVIMHTVFDENDKIFDSILAGANGYLLKGTKPDRMKLAIEDVMVGGAPLSPTIATKALQLIKGSSEEGRKEFNLTNRELEILTHIANGKGYQEIATLLFISAGTVRKHIENIYQKLQVHNKVDAVKLALKYNLVVPE